MSRVMENVDWKSCQIEIIARRDVTLFRLAAMLNIAIKTRPDFVTSSD